MDGKDKCTVPENKLLDAEILRTFMKQNCSCESMGLIQRDNITSFHCDPFPVNHSFYIQLIYCFMYGLLVLFSIGGNLTVAWII